MDYKGKRCHYKGIGFGTIVESKEVSVEGGMLVWKLRIQFDDGRTRLKSLDQVELIEDTQPEGAA
jgi:hypothetical protein